MAEVEYPFTVEPFQTEVEPGTKLIVKPGNYILPVGYEDEKERIYNMKFKPDDILVVSYPKTGTHWISEMLWAIWHADDPETFKEVRSGEMVMFLDLDILDGLQKKEVKMKLEKGEALSPREEQMLTINSLKKFEDAPSPRFGCTHLPFSLLPPSLLDTCKVIYIVRNPADTTTSYYHFMRAMDKCTAIDLEGFYNMTIQDAGTYGPFWTHVNEAYDLRHHKNMAFFVFEDMKKDLKGNVMKMAEFLGKTLTESQVEKITDHLTFDSMKKKLDDDSFLKKRLNPGSKFMRKGIVGDWKNHMAPELEDRFKEWWKNGNSKHNLRFEGVDL